MDFTGGAHVGRCLARDVSRDGLVAMVCLQLRQALVVALAEWPIVNDHRCRASKDLDLVGLGACGHFVEKHGTVDGCERVLEPLVGVAGQEPEHPEPERLDRIVEGPAAENRGQCLDERQREQLRALVAVR
eukprot:Amastigsp_a676970_15.p4 type:complete len:131 gc:universal Amastigsp_a676970_15:3-395(+)